MTRTLIGMAALALLATGVLYVGLVLLLSAHDYIESLPL